MMTIKFPFKSEGVAAIADGVVDEFPFKNEGAGVVDV